MAYENSTIDRAINDKVSGEVLDTGDAIKTVFTIDIGSGNKLELIKTVFDYTIGSITYQATVDSSGTVTGTNISSGSIDELGDGTITFSTALDNSTDLTCDYQEKGLLRKILEFVLGDTTTQNVGTGTGSSQTVSGTLATTGLSAGQNMLTFFEGGLLQRVFDDGAGNFDHISITASSFTPSTGVYSVTLTADNTTAIEINTVKGKNSGEEGRDWLVVYEDRTQDNSASPNNAFSTGDSREAREIVLRNTGSSGTSPVYIGMREFYDSGGANFGFNAIIYRTFSFNDNNWNKDRNESGWNSYNSSQERYSELAAHMMIDNSMEYWLMSNKNRVMFCGRSNSNYMFCYLGRGVPFSSNDAYPQPLFAGVSGGVTDNATTIGNSANCWKESAVGSSDRVIFALSESNNFISNAASLECFPDRSTGSSNPSGISTLRNPDSGVVLKDQVFAVNTTSLEFLFNLEGIFALSTTAVSAEDTLTCSGDTYIVFPNINRSTYRDFAAVLAE